MSAPLGQAIVPPSIVAFLKKARSRRGSKTGSFPYRLLSSRHIPCPAKVYYMNPIWLIWTGLQRFSLLSDARPQLVQIYCGAMVNCFIASNFFSCASAQICCVWSPLHFWSAIVFPSMMYVEQVSVNLIASYSGECKAKVPVRGSGDILMRKLQGCKVYTLDR